MVAYSPEEWKDLFVASAGASAALTGLVFVAVSINLERILAYPGLPERALQTVLLLLAVVVVSILGLVPGQSRTALGVELLVAGLASAALVGLLFRSADRQSGGDRSYLLGHVLLVTPGLLLLIVGSVSVLAGAGGGLYWTLAGIVVAFLGAVVNAWVLLVEILR